MSDLFQVHLPEQIACVEREIAVRKSVYPRMVAFKRMSEAKASREIAAMEAVLKTLQNVLDT